MKYHEADEGLEPLYTDEASCGNYTSGFNSLTVNIVQD